ncbi:hypothetical protein C8Q73DRAFT_782020 [Cubamyces lactineus]|nr:hypothetical protein C8Q73DRAFT_782020 [Cubamyces lactineus]
MGNRICGRIKASGSAEITDESRQAQVSATSTTAASTEHRTPNSDAPLPGIPLAKPVPMTLTMPQSNPSLPPRPEFIPFTVTNLCSSLPWDELDYMTFPERHGWVVHHQDKQCHDLCPPGYCNGGLAQTLYKFDVADGLAPPMLSRADGSSVSGTSKAAFLQAWLFFGTLHEVSRLCGLSIDVEAEFLIDGGRAISTAALNGLAGRWFASLDHTSAGDKAFMQKIFTIYRHLALLLNEELIRDSGSKSGRKMAPVFTYTPEEARVFFLIDVLLRTIGLHLVLHCYSPAFSYVGWNRNVITQNVDWIGRRIEGYETLEDYVNTQLEERGWCPSELQLMGDELVFASFLDRPRIRDHSNCGDTVCSAYQTDEATYKTVHVDETCDCDFVCVFTDDLTQALDEDKIPAILISEDLGLEVVDTVSYPYIALSHVLVGADGLGNPFQNALPKCQLRRLRAYIVGLYNTYYRGTDSTSSPAVAFWMDTLCVPVDEEAKAFRKKAIQLLGKTYHEATAVLVLDRELEIVNAASAPFLEIGLRILCSGWVKRLWTLQEATLASEAHGEEKIYFQMGDGPLLYQKYDRDRPAVHVVPNDTAFSEVAADERTLLYDDGVMLLLGEQLPSVRAMRVMREGWSPFRAIYSATEHRTTSKAEDVPLCVASLLGLDITTIVHAPDGEHRLKAFYLLMRVIPHSVLWVEDAAKLSIVPFRWAPSSVAACPLSAFLGKWDNDICDEEGLHTRPYSSFMLEDIAADDRQDRDASSFPSRFRLVDAGTGAHYGALWHSKDRRAVPLPGPDRTIAIIMRSPERGGKMPNAAFILVTRDSTGIDDGEAEWTGTIIGYRYFDPEAGGPEDTVVYCAPMSESQRWCIT